MENGFPKVPHDVVLQGSVTEVELTLIKARDMQFPDG